MARIEGILLGPEDNDLLQHTWWLVKGYPAGRINGKYTYLHQVVLARKLGGIPLDRETDHVNGNKLDNRRENLRAVTSSQNKMNRDKYPRTSSRYIGVSYMGGTHKRRKHWRAYVKVAGKQIAIGYFLTQEQAARARDKVALLLYGEYGRLNHA